MRKKILAVVLCLMTAVAFMPTFAFAANGPAGHLYAKVGTYAWNDDFTVATADIYDDMRTPDNYTDDVLYKSGVEADVYADKVFNGSTGIITATAYWYETDAIGGATRADAIGTTTAKYVDLTGAKVNTDVAELDADVYLAKVAAAKAAGKSGYALSAINEVSGLTVVCPAGMKWTNAASKKITNYVNNTSLFNAIMVGATDYESYVDGTYTLPVTVNEGILAHMFANGGVFIAANTEVDGVVGTPDNGKIAINVTVHTQFKYLELGVEGAKKANSDKDIDVVLNSANEFANNFIYDGQSHAIKINNKDLTAKWFVKNAKTGKYEVAESLSVKDADTYYFAVIVYHEGKYRTFKSAFIPFKVKVDKRHANIYSIQKVFNKTYDGEGFVLSQDNYTSVQGKYKGIVAGETLITATEATAANVGTYVVLPVWDEDVCANYDIDQTNVKAEVNIEKATNKIHVVNGTYKIKKGSKKAIKASTDFGTIEYQKISGNSKIKVSKAGEIEVAKSAKAGKIYSVKVKAEVEKTNNYDAAAETITLKVKVAK